MENAILLLLWLGALVSILVIAEGLCKLFDWK
jgi:hypothetical protein